MLTSLNVHNKCPANSFCNLCLLRSSIFKINLQTGRQSIKPVEVECQPFCTVEMMHNELLKCVLDNASQSVPSFYSIITPQWTCSCCRSADTNNTENIIILDNEARNRKITHLVEEKYNCIKQKHLEEALEHFVCHDNDFIMSLKEEQTSCVFYSSQTFELNLDAVLEFAGKSWRCVGVISNSNESFFKVNNKWFECSEENEIFECCNNFLITDGSVAVYDQMNYEWNDPVNIRKNNTNEKLCYTGEDLINKLLLSKATLGFDHGIGLNFSA